MVVETGGPEEFRWKLRDIARSGDTPDLAMTTARMLAAARLDPPGLEGVHFLDESRELTRPDWMAMLGALSKQWRREHPRTESPFDSPAERPLDTPGVLENLRRLVLRWVRTDGTAVTVPDWLLQNVLDLLHPRDLLAARLDPGVRDLFDEALGITAKSRVFCAYEWTAGIALQIAARRGADVTLDLEERTVASLCLCLGLAAKLRLHVREGDPLKLARSDLAAAPLLPDAGYDVAIVIPPFGGRRPDSDDEAAFGTGLPPPPSIEAAGVSLALARGRRSVACLLPSSFLFKATKADQSFKDRAIRDFGLTAVVALPRGTYSGTLLATAMLLFKPKSASPGKQNILMVDARGERDRQAGPEGRGPAGIAELLRTREPTELSALVSLDEIAANDFNLSVERYVLEPAALRMRELAAKATTVALDDVAELYRPQALPKAPDGSPRKGFFEVGAADTDEVGLVRQPTKEVLLTQDFAQHARRARLENGDILLVIKGSVGKVGFVRNVPDDATWLASQSFVSLRLRRHGPLNDPRVLHRFLSSDLGQTTLQSLRVGTTVPGLQMASVRRLSIVIPSAEEQKVIGDDVEALFDLQDRIDQMRDQLAARQRSMWPDGKPANGAAARGNSKGERRKSLKLQPGRKTLS